MRMEQIWSWIEDHKPGVILEIGTWNGRHAERMIKSGAKKYVGFDIWEDGSEELDEYENNAKKRVTQESVQEYLSKYDVELIKGNTRETLRDYAKDKEPFVDMALIDGGHSRHTIRSDMMNLLPIMKDSGVIFFDDYYFNCPQKDVGAQLVLAEANFKYTVLPKVDKARDGSLIKLAMVNMIDIPKMPKHSTPEEQSWKYEP